MKNVMFYHVSRIGRCQEISDQILNRVFSSGLIDKLENIFITVLGNNLPLTFPNNDKIQIIHRGNLGEMEHPSMLAIKSFAETHDDYNILYTQSAGVTSPTINPCLEDRREYMIYFNIEKFEHAIEKLKTNDTYGVELRNNPTLHYSGNFWWGTSKYIRTLKKVTDLPLILTDRHKSEFWICSGQGTHYCAWDTGIDNYNIHLHRNPASNYKL